MEKGMIGLIAFATTIVSTGERAPTCRMGDYISVCDFIPATSSAYRIVSRAEGAAENAGPHVLTTEYRINGASCKGSSRWSAGTSSVSADCVARLRAGTSYHIVALTAGQAVKHRGNVEITILPSGEAPNLVVP
jgi:hypothetical protein